MPRSELPPALPPEVRPVGQLIAEALRRYGDSFWRVLPIGLRVAVVERLPFRATFTRAVRLARADYTHALGALAAVVIVFGVTKIMLILLLHGTADAAERIALFLADLVLSPLLFLVPALLYFDQAARVVESAPRSRRRRHGDL